MIWLKKIKLLQISDFRFWPMRWLLSGYRLGGIDFETAEVLEECKVEYMEARGYLIEGSVYDAGCARTSRPIEVKESGK